MQKKQMIITVVTVLVVMAGIGFWYWSKRGSEVSLPKSAERKEKKLQENVGGGLGASIFEKSQNPIVDKLPETNPFGKAPINPLKSIYTNPFE